MREDVQEQVAKLWLEATTESLPNIGDLPGYKQDFLNLFGFGFEDDAAIDAFYHKMVMVYAGWLSLAFLAQLQHLKHVEFQTAPVMRLIR